MKTNTSTQSEASPEAASAKPTPGPWEADGLSSASSGAIIVNSKWGEVARVAWTGDKQREANARLIASAPEMACEIADLRASNAELVAACKLALECGDEVVAERAVRAAVARAEGRAS